MMNRVLVIVGSVRPTRIGDQVAEWVVKVLSRVSGPKFEIVDLRDWRLPLDDEPDQPAHGAYVQRHTQAWSEKIKSGDGFIFVTPQYNWGYPASLKNALDHLYEEWKGKPAVIVSYGHRGGVRAAEQLHQVLLGLHMAPVSVRPALIFNSHMFDAQERLADPASAFAQYESAMLQAVQELLAVPYEVY